MTDFDVFIPLTDAEWAALNEIAVLRIMVGHLASCLCHRCSAARAVWVGDLDELERLLAEMETTKPRAAK